MQWKFRSLISNRTLPQPGKDVRNLRYYHRSIIILTRPTGSRKIVDDSDDGEAFETIKSPIKTKAVKKECVDTSMISDFDY